MLPGIVYSSELLPALKSLQSFGVLLLVVLHTHDSAYLDLHPDLMHAEYRSKGPF